MRGTGGAPSRLRARCCAYRVTTSKSLSSLTRLTDPVAMALPTRYVRARCGGCGYATTARTLALPWSSGCSTVSHSSGVVAPPTSPHPKLVEAGGGGAVPVRQPARRVIACSVGDEIGRDALPDHDPWCEVGELAVELGPELRCGGLVGDLEGARPGDLGRADTRTRTGDPFMTSRRRYRVRGTWPTGRSM
jgi:hypothetical protein